MTQVEHRPLHNEPTNCCTATTTHAPQALASLTGAYRLAAAFPPHEEYDAADQSQQHKGADGDASNGAAREVAAAAAASDGNVGWFCM